MTLPFHQSSRPSSAYTRHLQQVSAYLHYYGGSKPQPSSFRTERQLLEENHKFIRDDDDGDEAGAGEKEIARRYYEKLFREFALVELGRWREGMADAGWENDQVAMRWRTKDEVLSGKGQFTCASLSCSRRDDVVIDPEAGENGDPQDGDEQASRKRRRGDTGGGLQTFELNFGYVEEGIKKNALVKVRVCQRCARKLGKAQGAAPREKPRRSGSGSQSRSRTRRHERSPDSRRRKKERRDHGENLDVERRGVPPGEEGYKITPSASRDGPRKHDQRSLRSRSRSPAPT
ncbi:hypothetical protein FGG08_001822 [Glutinoglossum americanum]|uniref:Folate-sensitive fragile site protein Fra10Ac1-domain-containing protein n=1 Tax=Glutinoglossum americanum TaxID=1670608 RepID=A0A9P8IG92_9PEZI|nr:hypothetical protein FGG08_001822 [Glutinoglossum americanum]